MTVLWVERHCEYDHDTLAAAELRRLHEVNAELLAALDEAFWRVMSANTHTNIQLRAGGRTPGPGDLEPVTHLVAEKGRTVTADEYIRSVLTKALGDEKAKAKLVEAGSPVAPSPFSEPVTTTRFPATPRSRRRRRWSSPWTQKRSTSARNADTSRLNASGSSRLIAWPVFGQTHRPALGSVRFRNTLGSMQGASSSPTAISVGTVMPFSCASQW